MTEDATTAFLRVLQEKLAAAGRISFEEIVTRSWASATFTGARHEVVVALDGERAEAAADRFVGNLAVEEFDLHGHLVADIAVVSDQRSPGQARIALEALTVEES